MSCSWPLSPKPFFLKSQAKKPILLLQKVLNLSRPYIGYRNYLVAVMNWFHSAIASHLRLQQTVSAALGLHIFKGDGTFLRGHRRQLFEASGYRIFACCCIRWSCSFYLALFGLHNPKDLWRTITQLHIPISYISLFRLLFVWMYNIHRTLDFTLNTFGRLVEVI